MAEPTPPTTTPRRPRFGVDCAATVFPYPPGVQRVVAELCAHLSHMEKVECIPLRPHTQMTERRWRHRELPRLEKERGLDGILSFTSAFPIAGKGLRIQTIHELPWLNGEAENAGFGHKLWARHGWRRASQIIVPSNHVFADLEDFSPRAAARAHVIAWAVGDLFRDTVEAPPDLAIPAAPFFLAVGATRSKKRLDNAIHGLAAESTHAPHLLVTGSPSPAAEQSKQLSRSLGLQDRVHFLGHLDDASLAALYHLAQGCLLLAPSEGFGFPALEALAAGIPVLCPAQTAQAELAGESTYFVDPTRPKSIANAMRIAIAEAGTGGAALLRAQRQKRAGEFTWERTALALEDVLLRALRG
jgi:glycosyltransferase involved in cell wall biosynthesis